MVSIVTGQGVRSKRSDGLWDPPSLPFNGYQDFLVGGKAVWA